MRRRRPSDETLVTLRRKLEDLSTRSPERQRLLQDCAELHNVSVATEPTLTRHGYTTKVLTEMLGTKPSEIKALFQQTLEADRVRELKEKMLAAGLPV